MRRERLIKTSVCLLCCALLTAFTAFGSAETIEWRGYLKKGQYQYVLFGTYPTQKDGTTEPVLWRILGINDGVACLMTEYVVDFIVFNQEKDTDLANPLPYKESYICKLLNEQIVYEMFTEDERCYLVEMEDGRGLLSVPTVMCELRNPEYGFLNGNYTVDKRRQAKGTPYAHQKGLVKASGNANSWYWTTDWRKPGYRWIVGNNGHISVHSILKHGGLRAICYVDILKIACFSGTGTRTDPFQIVHIF